MKKAARKPASKPAPRGAQQSTRRESSRTRGHANAPWSGGPVERGDAIKVQATQLGYYDHKRQRPGDVFTISSMTLFSEKWMVLVDADVPERTTTPSQAMRKHHDDVMADRHLERTGQGATGSADVLGAK